MVEPAGHGKMQCTACALICTCAVCMCTAYTCTACICMACICMAWARCVHCDGTLRRSYGGRLTLRAPLLLLELRARRMLLL